MPLPFKVPLKHTPYDGSSKPFEIALRPLDIEHWIEIDDDLDRYLDEKRRLYNTIPDKVFAAEADTLAAQQEVLDLLVDFLLKKYPGIYVQDGSAINIAETEHSVEITDQSIQPLLRAAWLVQEDLVLMRRNESGWRLVAGAVSFPSSWELLEKFSKPLQEVHAPVPGLGPGTRKAHIIERIFDNLQVEQPVERFNWSIYANADLYHDDRSGEQFDHSETNVATQSYLRVERQTLQKLPESGDCLFTIRIHIDPMRAIVGRADKEKIVEEFISSLNSLDQDQLEYKVMIEDREQLIGRLEELIA